MQQFTHRRPDHPEAHRGVSDRRTKHRVPLVITPRHALFVGLGVQGANYNAGSNRTLMGIHHRTRSCDTCGEGASQSARRRQAYQHTAHRRQAGTQPASQPGSSSAHAAHHTASTSPPHSLLDKDSHPPLFLCIDHSSHQHCPSTPATHDSRNAPAPTAPHRALPRHVPPPRLDSQLHSLPPICPCPFRVVRRTQRTQPTLSTWTAHSRVSVLCPPRPPPRLADSPSPSSHTTHTPNQPKRIPPLSLFARSRCSENRRRALGFSPPA